MPAVVQPQSPHETPVNLQLSWKKTESPTSKVFLPLIPLCSQNIDLGLDSVQMLLRIKGPFNIYEDKKRGRGSAKSPWLSTQYRSTIDNHFGQR